MPLDVVFMGTPEFAVPSLDAIASSSDFRVAAVYTQPDRPVGRGLEMRASPVKARAIELGLPIFQPERLSQPGEFEKLSALKPGAIVVVAYGQILKRAVLELPRLGCVNVHSSLLPRWRGAAPIQWAILDGDAESGVTTQRMAEKLDAGDVLMQARTSLGADETAGTLHDRLARLGAELVLPTLRGLERGELKGRPQDESRVTYAFKLTKEMEWLDAAALDAAALDRRVRALNPWPGTSVGVEGEGDVARLRVRAAKPRLDLSAEPGTIYERAGMVLLACASGSLELLALQWEGKRAVDAAGFLNGLRGRAAALPLRVCRPPQTPPRK